MLQIRARPERKNAVRFDAYASALCSNSFNYCSRGISERKKPGSPIIGAARCCSPAEKNFNFQLLCKPKVQVVAGLLQSLLQKICKKVGRTN